MDSRAVGVLFELLGLVVFCVAVFVAVVAFHRTAVGCNPPPAICHPAGWNHHL
jgi:hypothetical protein